MDQSEEELNTQLALDAAGEFGIWPLMTAQEMTSADPDPLAMVMFLSQFYQLVKDTAPPAGETRERSEGTEVEGAELNWLAVISSLPVQVP